MLWCIWYIYLIAYLTIIYSSNTEWRLWLVFSGHLGGWISAHSDALEIYLSWVIKDFRCYSCLGVCVSPPTPFAPFFLVPSWILGIQEVMYVPLAVESMRNLLKAWASYVVTLPSVPGPNWSKRRNAVMTLPLEITQSPRQRYSAWKCPICLCMPGLVCCFRINEDKSSSLPISSKCTCKSHRLEAMVCQ